MKNLLKLTAAATLMSGPALADIMQTNIEGAVLPGVYQVTGNNTGYTSINGNSALKYTAFLFYDAGNSGRVKRWRIDPEVKIGDTPMNPFFLTTYGHGKSYSIGNRPKKINLFRQIVIPQSFLKSTIVSRCNDIAEAKIQGGQSVVQAYSQETQIQLSVSFIPEVKASGLGPKVTEHMEYVQGPVIRCMPIQMAPSAPEGSAEQDNTPTQPGRLADDSGAETSPGLKAPQAKATLKQIRRSDAATPARGTLNLRATKPARAGN